MGVKTFLKSLIDRTPYYGPVQSWIESNRQRRELAEWQDAGCPMPPPHVIKQENLLEHSRVHGLKILVETGTYLGEMIAAMSPHFERIYSIELSEFLNRKAQWRFRNNPKIELIHGDSGQELGKLLPRIDKPTMFWLDGHYSAGVTARGEKDTPIYEELQHIFSAPDLGHVIIIDDARCFGTDAGYPSQDELIAFIRKYRPAATVVVRNDSIIIT